MTVTGVLLLTCASFYLLKPDISDSTINAYWLPDRATRQTVDIQSNGYAEHLALIDKTEIASFEHENGTVFSTSTTHDKAIRIFEAPKSLFSTKSCPNVLMVNETPGPYQTGKPICENIGTVAGSDVFRIMYTGGRAAPQEIFTTRGNVFIAFVIPAADLNSDKDSILDFVNSFKPIATKDLSAWLSTNAQTMARQNKQVDDYQSAIQLAHTKLGFTVYHPILTSEWNSYLSESGSDKTKPQITGQSPEIPELYVLQYKTVLPGKQDISHSEAEAILTVYEYNKTHFSYIDGTCGPAPWPLNGQNSMISCIPRNGSYVSVAAHYSDNTYRLFRVIGDTVVMFDLRTDSVGGNADLTPSLIDSIDTIAGQLEQVNANSLGGTYTFVKGTTF